MIWSKGYTLGIFNNELITKEFRIVITAQIEILLTAIDNYLEYKIWN